MGTTLANIHVRSKEKTCIDDYVFHSFSDGWQTYLPAENLPENFSDSYKLARMFSRKIDEPVLLFCIVDSDLVHFAFLQHGHCVSEYCGRIAPSKNLYGIPALVGYTEGNKRKLSHILSCTDTEFQVMLLEEYFGVCLLAFPEELENNPNAWHREQGDKLYLEYKEQDKKLRGKDALFSAELVCELKGSVYWNDFGNKTRPKEHAYLFGYTTAESKACDLTPFVFENGQINFISWQEYAALPDGKYIQEVNNELYTIEYVPMRIRFSEKAPYGFAGKEFHLPLDYTNPVGFDKHGHFLITNLETHILVVDKNFEVVSRLSVRGAVVDYRDDYVLTCGHSSGYSYMYNPYERIRIYRINKNK